MMSETEGCFKHYREKDLQEQVDCVNQYSQ